MSLPVEIQSALPMIEHTQTHVKASSHTQDTHSFKCIEVDIPIDFNTITYFFLGMEIVLMQ